VTNLKSQSTHFKIQTDLGAPVVWRPGNLYPSAPSYASDRRIIGLIILIPHSVDGGIDLV